MAGEPCIQYPTKFTRPGTPTGPGSPSDPFLFANVACPPAAQRSHRARSGRGRDCAGDFKVREFLCAVFKVPLLLPREAPDGPATTTKPSIIFVPVTSAATTFHDPHRIAADEADRAHHVQTRAIAH